MKKGGGEGKGGEERGETARRQKQLPQRGQVAAVRRRQRARAVVRQNAEVLQGSQSRILFVFVFDFFNVFIFSLGYVPEPWCVRMRRCLSAVSAEY